jgi:hypothetical protein
VSIENADYITFRDSVIVALADDQEPPGLGYLDIEDLCKRHGIFAHETWISTVGHDMQSLGWGKADSDLEEHRFLINGGGLARAAEVRQTRKPVSFFDRVRSVPRSDWIAILAFVVSVIALFKDS